MQAPSSCSCVRDEAVRDAPELVAAAVLERTPVVPPMPALVLFSAAETACELELMPTAAPVPAVVPPVALTRALVLIAGAAWEVEDMPVATLVPRVGVTLALPTGTGFFLAAAAAGAGAGAVPTCCRG